MPAPTERQERREAIPNDPFLLNRTQVQKLLQDNRTTLILNRPLFTINFGQNGELFNPKFCDPIRLVHVRQYDGTIKELIQDGNHRIIAGENYAQQNNIPNDEKYLPARYVTDQYSDTGSLTPEQFLALVIIPTQEHTKIAPERMAYTLFSQWEQMVGPEVAQRFSVLGALSHRDPESPSTIGVPNVDQQQVTQQLTSLKKIISETRYTPQQMVSELLTLISNHQESKVIDRDQATQLIQGVFSLPTVAPRIEEAFGDPTEAMFSQNTQRLAREIVDAMTIYKEKPTEVKTIYELLMDTTISVDTIRKTIKPGTNHHPSTLYREIKLQQRYEGLETKLRENLAADTPEYARALPFINRLTKSTDYSPDGWQIPTIISAARALHTADTIDPSTLSQEQRAQLKKAKQSVTGSPLSHLHKRTESLEILLAQLQQGDQTEAPRPSSTSDAEKARLEAAVRHLTSENSGLREKLNRLKMELEIANRTWKDEVTRRNQAEEGAAELRAQLAATQAALRLAQEQLSTQQLPAEHTTATHVVFDATRSDSPQRRSIEWERVILTDQDWKTARWLEGAAGHDLEKITTIANNRARKNIFAELKKPEIWRDVLEQITYTLSSGETVTGLDALHYGLTPRLKHVAEICGWTRESPEVNFLIANHFVNAIGALSPNKAYMETALTRLTSLQFSRDDYFFNVLKMLLYTDPGDPAHTQAFTYLRDHNGDREIINRWQRQHPNISFEEFIRETVRGNKREE